jgi:hypothetical protein
MVDVSKVRKQGAKVSLKMERGTPRERRGWIKASEQAGKERRKVKGQKKK